MRRTLAWENFTFARRPRAISLSMLKVPILKGWQHFVSSFSPLPVSQAYNCEQTLQWRSKTKNVWNEHWFSRSLVLGSIKSERKNPENNQGNLRCEDRRRGYHHLQFMVGGVWPARTVLNDEWNFSVTFMSWFAKNLKYLHDCCSHDWIYSWKRHNLPLTYQI